MLKTQKIDFKNIKEHQIKNIVKKFIKLLSSQNFIVWLEGPLGVGKTMLTKYILLGLGLDPTIPVLSPSFTYMTEYQINNLWYAHLDLYRAVQNLDINELGLLDYKEYKGIFIEWPTKISNINQIYPTHIIEINFTKNINTRNYSFSTIAKD